MISPILVFVPNGSEKKDFMMTIVLLFVKLNAVAWFSWRGYFDLGCFSLLFL